MKINLPVRFKNPTFWINLVGSVVVIMIAYFKMNWSDVTTWATFGNLFVKSISNPVVFFAILGNVWNALNDPTTKGLSDSEKALTYTEPK